MATVASPAGGYVWEDPGDSIIIQVNFDLVERLGAAVKQGLGTGQRGVEIGGILIGRALPGFGRTVLIEDFELSTCEHLRGASYTLSPGDRQALSRRLERRSARQVVGYFRSHTRPGMYLDQDDFAVFSRYFPEASQVFLLVRPEAEGPAMGGFFFWEDGDMNRRSPYRQFPFDSERLAAGGFPIAGVQPVAAPAARLKPVAVPAVPKPQASKPLREPRAPLRLPSLPWLVVPVIAGLFLAAGLFVSENGPAKPDAVVKAKVSPPVDKIEPLLPQPEPQAAAPAVEPAPAPPVEAAPVRVPKRRPIHKPMLTPPAAPAAPPTRAARAVDPPPVLTAPIQRTEPAAVAAILPSHASAPAPPEAEVSYEQAHVGVFRRAFHKAADVPASPIRKVSPAGSAGAGEVDVKVFIDEAGKVSRAQVLTKRSDMADAALRAAREWQFTPARKHDKPVASEMVLHFRF